MRLLLLQLAIHSGVHFSAEQFWMQYKERKLALSFIVTILKTTTIHNHAHFPSFKTVPQFPISHFSLVAWKIHLCKYSVCWLSVIISEPSRQLQVDYFDTVSKRARFLPSLVKTDNSLEGGSPDLWEQSQESWAEHLAPPPGGGHVLPKPSAQPQHQSHNTTTHWLQDVCLPG